MSGKGGSGGSGGGGGGGGGGGEPSLVSGWEYHGYSNSDTQGGDRYVYVGKDDDGTPEFLDYGPQSKK
jgi:hypothetical protein